ncbi:MAG: dihydrolipoyllysine-residue succinyltransferase, partial [Bacteroidales bacterium]|nr:dihydrolipoyllysine-residue succinyltransferase [Bacteroidales bacterium]
MQVEIKIPSPGESVTVADIARWMVQDGEMVEKDQEVGEIESEKATLPLIAPASGRIKILVQAGNTVPVGTMVATIETTLQEKQGNEKGRKVKGGGRKQEAMNETHNILE